MPPPPANLVNLERVDLSLGLRTLLAGVSLGVGAGERIGVVGRNGGERPRCYGCSPVGCRRTPAG